MNPKDVIINAIRDSWCRETSYDPDNWNKRNPAYGQCAVSSMVYQLFFGGMIYKATVILPDGTTESHYLNALFDPSDQEFLVDLTIEQFPDDTQLVDYKQANSSSLYANKETLDRFQMLSELVYQKIKQCVISIDQPTEGQLIGLLNMLDIPVLSVNFWRLGDVEIKVLNFNADIEEQILATWDNVRMHIVK
jgi:hypothetical protein